MDIDTNTARTIEAEAGQAPSRRRGCGGLFLVILLVMGVVWGAALGYFVSILHDTRQTIQALETYRPKANSKVFASDGLLLGEFSSEEVHRQLVNLNEVPLYLQKAVVATEDATFYEHKGVSPAAILSAVLFRVKTGKTRGASTITMQVVRSVETLEVGLDRTYKRKIHEALTALQVERDFTKDEILELYLNLIFFGGRANGIQTAAQQYFAKNVWELALGDCAMLASLPRSPNRINPFKNIESARQHRDIVLDQMLEQRFITQEEHDTAVKESLEDSVLTPEKRKQLEAEGKGVASTNKFTAPYFVEEVRQQILSQAGRNEGFGEGLEIHTTLDPHLQRIAEQTLMKGLDAFDAKKLEQLKRDKRENEFVPVSGALVCIDNRPGYRGFVRAMVGGRDFEKEKYNTATQARRQPGSSIKPFVWATAIASGMTPSTVIVDAPYARTDAWGNIWAPKNFGGNYQGPITLRNALAKSINIVSVKLVERVSMPAVRAQLERAGIRTPIGNSVGLTIALGSPEVTVIDHCTAYSCFPNAGVRYDPILIQEINNRDNVTLYDYKNSARKEQAMTASVAYVMVDMLEGVCTFGTGANTQEKWEKAQPGRPRAGKTGTTNESRNAWFCGFTADYTCVVWVGYRDNRSLGQGKEFTGGRLANPVWTDFMIAAEDGLPVRDFEKADGVTFCNVDRNSGLAGGSFKEVFVTGTTPPAEWVPDEQQDSGPAEPDTRLLELF